MKSVYIQDVSITCPLGGGTNAVKQKLLATDPERLQTYGLLNDGRRVPVGEVALVPDDDGVSDTRCNRIADHCLGQLESTLPDRLASIPVHRVGVVIGTCTSGVREGIVALKERLANGTWPEAFRFSAQEMGDTARHIAKLVGAGGPVFGVSTACTSGAKALASAARLIQADICDVVVAGGVDSLSELTLHGFAALESLSDEVCNPFSANRRGINIGEGGALFVLSREPSPVRLAGWGETADAYHISAPDPEGRGAQLAMEMALKSACATPSEIGYINLHGTATRLNDAMEAHAVARVFGLETPCSSTKPLTGHMLGAAGACEAVFAQLALETGSLPVHAWDGQRDDNLPPIRLVAGQETMGDSRRVMSCSYAFGGNNIALLLERQ